MPFIMMGYDQDAGVRTYAFKRIVDGIRTPVTVGVNLAVISGYGIRIQELPLLCRELLERQVEGQEASALTYTEGDMRVHADTCALAREAAALKRKPRNPPPVKAPALTARY